MPQLDPAVFLPQIFWLIVVFAALYIFIARNAAPKIADVLKKRQDRIADDLTAAEQLQAKAEEARIAADQVSAPLPRESRVAERTKQRGQTALKPHFTS